MCVRVRSCVHLGMSLEPTVCGWRVSACVGCHCVGGCGTHMVPRTQGTTLHYSRQ